MTVTTPKHHVIDETTALLAASEAGPTAPPDEEQLNPPPSGDDDTPLPKVQIFLLCYCRLIEPIAFFSVFPFVSQMIWEIGIGEEDVGFYTGLIESLFSLTQMLLMIPWGKAADKFGRKPVLVISLSGMAVSAALFGTSTQVWQMILFRCLAGVFGGTIVTVRAMITENSTPKTQARAFSFFAFSGNLGIFLGPLIGGGLAKPADQYPSVFGKIQFFKDFPYALPTFCTGAFSLSAAIIATLFVKETLTKTEDSSQATVPTSTWNIIKSPGVGIVLYIYGHVMLLGMAYTAVMPVFWFTPPSLGGFGFSPFMISVFLAIVGVAQAIWLLLAFPPFQHRFGTGGVLRVCSIAWPIFFIASPICSLFLRHHIDLAFWILAPIFTVFGSGVAMAFTAVQLALNDIAPSSSTLGTLNAVALTLVSGIRAIAPAVFTSIFASGIKAQILDGYFVWLILILVALGLTVTVRWLPAKAEGRLKAQNDD